MCIFSRRSKPSTTPPSKTRMRSTTRSTSTSGSTVFTNTTSTNNSRDSQVSSSSTSSSLAGIRELLGEGPVIYSFKELVAATGNFGDARKVGRSTFRAPLRGMDVAVVRKKGSLVPNYVDLIKVMSSVHHINLVRFLGACFRETEYVHVCYEFEVGVNLREALAGGSKAVGFTTLSKWITRIQIALDVAQGLEYLHDHTMPSFLHKHIKSTNIIVTNDLRAKIAKFGTPQLLGEVPSGLSVVEPKDSGRRKLVRSNSLKITGTPGYMAPEYVNHGTLSTKMDVFSYGVVLLELLSGQQSGPQYDPKTRKVRLVSLPETIREVFEDDVDARKKLRLWMDPKLRDSYPIDVAFSVARLGKLCVEADPALRPPMKNVAAKLSRHLEASEEWDRSFVAFRDLQSQTLEGR